MGGTEGAREKDDATFDGRAASIRSAVPNRGENKRSVRKLTFVQTTWPSQRLFLAVMAIEFQLDIGEVGLIRDVQEPKAGVAFIYAH